MHHFDRYYCPSATIFIPGVRFSFGFSGCRWYHHVFVGNSIFVVRYCSSNFAGSRRPQSSRAICKTYCRKQTIWWCKTIYSFKGECCECNAYHLCPGNHVYPYYIGRFLKCCNRKWYCTCICRSY